MYKKECIFLAILILFSSTSYALTGNTGAGEGGGDDYDAQLDACQQNPSSCDWGSLNDADIAANFDKLSGPQMSSLGKDRLETITKSMTRDQMAKVNLKDPQIKAAFDKMSLRHRTYILGHRLSKEQGRYIVKKVIKDFFGFGGGDVSDLNLDPEYQNEFDAYLTEQGYDVDIDLGGQSVKLDTDEFGNPMLITPDGTKIKLESLKTGSHSIEVTADGVIINGKKYKNGEVVESDASEPTGTYTITSTDEFSYPILTDTHVSGNSITGMTVYPNGTVRISNASETHIKNSTSEVIIKGGSNVIINPDGSYTADFIAQLRDGKLVMLNAYNVSSDGNLTADKADSAIIDQSVATTIEDYYYDKDETFAVGSADLIIVDGSYFADVGSTNTQKTTFTTEQGKLTKATLVSAKDNNSFDIPFYDETATFSYGKGDIISFIVSDPYLINMSAYAAFSIPFSMYSTGYKVQSCRNDSIIENDRDKIILNNAVFSFNALGFNETVYSCDSKNTEVYYNQPLGTNYTYMAKNTYYEMNDYNDEERSRRYITKNRTNLSLKKARYDIINNRYNSFMSFIDDKSILTGKFTLKAVLYGFESTIKSFENTNNISLEEKYCTLKTKGSNSIAIINSNYFIIIENATDRHFIINQSKTAPQIIENYNSHIDANITISNVLVEEGKNSSIAYYINGTEEYDIHAKAQNKIINRIIEGFEYAS